jgi:hypothetical protein
VTGVGPAFSSPLSRGAARVLYNAADALAGDRAARVDVAAHAARELRHRGRGAARRTWLLLLWLEWEPLLALRSRRGFSWLPREERRALLSRWERSPLPCRRRAAARLRALVEGALAAGGGSAPGAQSSDA